MDHDGYERLVNSVAATFASNLIINKRFSQLAWPFTQFDAIVKFAASKKLFDWGRDKWC